jgi:hypothetical protein
MNNDTITIDLNNIEPLEFSWNETDMTSMGVSAQEIGAIYSTMITAPSIVTLGSSPTTSTVSINTGYTFSSTYDDMETRLARLEKIIAEEEEVRANHPAVQMAYDEYRLLYILSKKNAGDRLTDE